MVVTTTRRVLVRVSVQWSKTDMAMVVNEHVVSSRWCHQAAVREILECGTWA